MNQNPQVNINPDDLVDVVCEKCGNGLFIQSFFLKKLSALVSPTGQEAVIPLQVYSCGNCGHINSKLNPTISEETKTDN